MQSSFFSLSVALSFTALYAGAAGCATRVSPIGGYDGGAPQDAADHSPDVGSDAGAEPPPTEACRPSPSLAGRAFEHVDAPRDLRLREAAFDGERVLAHDQNGRLFFSADGGASYVPSGIGVPAGYPTGLGYADDNFFVVTRDVALPVLRSEDGVTFVPATAGLPPLAEGEDNGVLHAGTGGAFLVRWPGLLRWAGDHWEMLPGVGDGGTLESFAFSANHVFAIRFDFSLTGALLRLGAGGWETVFEGDLDRPTAAYAGGDVVIYATRDGQVHRIDADTLAPVAMTSPPGWGDDRVLGTFVVTQVGTLLWLTHDMAYYYDGLDWVLAESRGLIGPYASYPPTCRATGGRVYCLTSPLHLSLDEGRTYAAVEGSATGAAVAIAASGSRVYVAGTQGLFASDDRGAHFSALPISSDGSSELSALSAREDTLLVGTTSDGIYRSVDRGQTLRHHNTTQLTEYNGTAGLDHFPISAFATRRDGLLFFGLEGGTEHLGGSDGNFQRTSNGIFFSDDAGASWSSANSGIPISFRTNFSQARRFPVSHLVADGDALVAALYNPVWQPDLSDGSRSPQLHFLDPGASSWVERSDGIVSGTTISLTTTPEGPLVVILSFEDERLPFLLPRGRATWESVDVGAPDTRALLGGVQYVDGLLATTYMDAQGVRVRVDGGAGWLTLSAEDGATPLYPVARSGTDLWAKSAAGAFVLRDAFVCVHEAP